MNFIPRIAVFAAAVSATIACQPDKNAEARTVTVSSRETQDPGTAAFTAKSTAAFRFVTDTTGNSARYRIREHLVGIELPNDAVGETSGVSGVIATDANGNLIPAESKFTVDVSTLKSDKDRRDGFVRRRVLEADQYPTVTLVPTAVRGIAFPLPTSGAKAFEIIGDLTVRGQTHPTTWKVNAQFQPGRMTGTAATAFTFTDFAIEQPRVPVVLSVGDTIKLELDFSVLQEAVKR
jgi:polyisoprenoid-binding protein YceI